MRIRPSHTHRPLLAKSFVGQLHINLFQQLSSAELERDECQREVERRQTDAIAQVYLGGTGELLAVAEELLRTVEARVADLEAAIHNTPFEYGTW